MPICGLAEDIEAGCIRSKSYSQLSVQNEVFLIGKSKCLIVWRQKASEEHLSEVLLWDFSAAGKGSCLGQLQIFQRTQNIVQNCWFWLLTQGKLLLVFIYIAGSTLTSQRDLASFAFETVPFLQNVFFPFRINILCQFTACIRCRAFHVFSQGLTKWSVWANGNL